MRYVFHIRRDKEIHLLAEFCPSRANVPMMRQAQDTRLDLQRRFPESQGWTVELFREETTLRAVEL